MFFRREPEVGTAGNPDGYLTTDMRGLHTKMYLCPDTREGKPKTMLINKRTKT